MFGIAGPVDGEGRVPVLVDIPQWGAVEERQLEKDLEIPTVKLLNDFVANAYGVLALDPNNPEDIL